VSIRFFSFGFEPSAASVAGLQLGAIASHRRICYTMPAQAEYARRRRSSIPTCPLLGASSMNRRRFFERSAFFSSSICLGLLEAQVGARQISEEELTLLEVALQDSAGGLVSPGARLEKLWGEGEFTEGGAWGPDDCLYFSDIGNALMKYDPKAGTVAAFRKPSGRSNGIVFDRKGRMIVAEGANVGGHRRVTATDLKTGKIDVLADKYDGKAFNSPNDVAVDAAGRVYVSDPRYVGDEPRELDFEAVFRIDPDGKVSRLDTGAFKPNGLVVSPDGKTLYVADNGGRRRVLLACPLDADGNVTPGKVLYDFADGRGIDGMTVTTDGRIVATAGKDAKSGIWVFKPDGTLQGVIPTPEPPANCEFGGPSRSTLYILAGVSLYRVETTMKGFVLS
jgi:gluconolactonase